MSKLHIFNAYIVFSIHVCVHQYHHQNQGTEGTHQLPEFPYALLWFFVVVCVCVFHTLNTRSILSGYFSARCPIVNYKHYVKQRTSRTSSKI